MQDITKIVDLRRVPEQEQEGDVLEKQENSETLDSSRALQQYLNCIPINSIRGIKNSPVVELKNGDSVNDAISLLYEKNVSGAPIADILDPDTTTGRFLDRYIGFVDFSTMVLWCIEKCEECHVEIKREDRDKNGWSYFFSLLQQHSQIGQTKIGELAKSFLLEPFFPVNLDETLFNILLLLSKHRLQVVPVLEQANSQVSGFVTQDAVIQLLLKSSGLEWFDSIADKALSEFRFGNEDHVPQVYGGQSVAEALRILWERRCGIVAVINQETGRLIGSLRNSDVHILLENDNVLQNRKSMRMDEFIHIETSQEGSDPTIERDLGALLLAGALRLKNSFLPRMDAPVTNKKTETLKQAMENLVETKSCFSFIVDDSRRVIGLLRSRDVIIEFAPPGIDSGIHGVGFFETALEQSGCHIKNGNMVCNHTAC